MQKRQPVVKKADRIHRKLLERAADDPFFVGWALAKYQHIQGINSLDLAHWLKCAPEVINRLALCRLPDPKKGNIVTDVQKIATFGPCDPEALLCLIRTVMSVQVMQEAVVNSSDGFLMAARDRIKSSTDHLEEKKKDDQS